MTATEMIKSAFAAWGVSQGSDGCLYGSDGSKLRMQWTQEESPLGKFSENAEQAISKLMLNEVFDAVVETSEPIDRPVLVNMKQPTSDT